jgi:hypothetical protein
MNSIGLFALNGGAVSGLQDTNCAGTVTQSQSVTGSYGNVDSLGRGAGSFSSSAGTSDFVYYVVSANRYRFLSSDSAVAFLGSADQQTKPSFTDSDFTGQYVIANSATSPTTVASMLTEIDPSAGNVPAGIIDINMTGTVSSANLTGAYSLNSSGYVTGTLSAVLNPLDPLDTTIVLPFSIYLVSPSQAYYLDLRTQVQGKIDFEGVSGGGVVYKQSGPLFSNAAWTGSFTTRQFGYNTNGGNFSPAITTSVAGQLSSNGSGLLEGTLDINDFSAVVPALQASGSYNVGISVPGRTTVKITTTDGTRNFVAYIINSGQIEMLDTDSSITGGGDAILQF